MKFQDLYGQRAFIIISLLFSVSFMGAYLHVPADYPTIQAALDAAGIGDEVVVAPGTYVEALQWPTTENVTLGGETQASDTTVSAPRNQRPLTRGAGDYQTIMIKDISLRNGRVAIGQGGGLSMVDATVTMVRCIIANNHCNYNGGGGYFSNCELHLLGCLIESNSTGIDNAWSSDGIGLYLDNCSGEIKNSVIRNHSQWYLFGAGIFCNGSVDFIGNLFEGNEQLGSDYRGGALYIYGNSLIQGNTFRNNNGIGSAISAQSAGGELVIENNLFEGNRSEYSHCGAIDCYDSASIRFNTFVENDPTAITCGSDSDVRNCIFTLSDCGIYAGAGVTVTSDYNAFWINLYDTSGLTPGPHDLFNSELLFFDDGEAHYLLSQTAAGQSETSPCVDAGEPEAAIPDGTTRSDGVADQPLPDLGYHYPYPADRSPTPTPTASPVYTPTPTPTATQVPPSTPGSTRTPVPSPTASPTAQPTTPPTLELDITANQPRYRAGDRFTVQLTIANHGEQQAADLYVGLEITDGMFYFWPSWAAYPPEVDFVSLNLWQEGVIAGTILDFVWPANAGFGENWTFHSALVEPESYSLLAYDSCSFSFE